MRLAVLADVHGNLPALEAVLADVEQQGVDGIIVAGDTVSGPCPVEAINQLRSRDSWIIKGNREQYFIDYDTGNMPPAWRTSQRWTTLRWSYHSLDRRTLDTIASLPGQRVIAIDGTAPVRVVHGSLDSPFEHLIPEGDPVTLQAFKTAGLRHTEQDLNRLADCMEQIEERVLVCGHSHIPWIQAREGRLALNPGAVGAPFNGDPRAQYALLTWRAGGWQTEHRAVAYDLALIREAFRESGMLAAGGPFARAWLLGIEASRNVPLRFVAHVNQVAADTGYTSGDVVPDSVWERAAATFDWRMESWMDVERGADAA